MSDSFTRVTSATFETTSNVTNVNRFSMTHADLDERSAQNEATSLFTFSNSNNVDENDLDLVLFDGLNISSSIGATNGSSKSAVAKPTVGRSQVDINKLADKTNIIGRKKTQKTTQSNLHRSQSGELLQIADYQNGNNLTKRSSSEPKQTKKIYRFSYMNLNHR